MTLTIEQLMHRSQVTFGTSGARGLVVDMTDQVCYAYTLAFIQYLKETQQASQNMTHIVLGGDLRDSTPHILNACARAIVDSDLQVINAGLLATPALALYGLNHKCPAIMVTGSHIPDDRNGIKFYKLSGEILKSDEVIIRRQEVILSDHYFTAEGQFTEQEHYLPEVNIRALDDYRSRYLHLFPENALTGKKIGIYQHSGVARDLIPELLEKLGAEVIVLARSDQFIPVDTEAVREEDCLLAKQWVAEYQLDAIVSTDGDADRPLISDETGEWLRGDIVGFLCAKYLQIDHLVTPVSSNTSVEQSDFFVAVKRTKIGSPYVIEAMNEYIDDHYQAVAGYEANGGFLLGTPVRKNDYLLTALPTRDAIIVLLAVLHSSVEQQLSISQLSAKLPQRYTYSSRVKNFATQRSQAFIAKYTASDAETNTSLIDADFSIFGSIKNINTIDGLRMTFSNNDIIHFRASGNAPEFRCYSESDSRQGAEDINKSAMAIALAQ